MVIGDADRAILIDLHVLNEAAGRVRSSRCDDIGFLNGSLHGDHNAIANVLTGLAR